MPWKKMLKNRANQWLKSSKTESLCVSRDLLLLLHGCFLLHVRFSVLWHTCEMKPSNLLFSSLLFFFFFFFFFFTVKLCFLFCLFVVVFNGIYCEVCMILLAFYPFKVKFFFFAPFCARKKNNTGSSDAFIKFLWYIFCKLHISPLDLARVLFSSFFCLFFFGGGGGGDFLHLKMCPFVPDYFPCIPLHCSAHTQTKSSNRSHTV